VAAIVLTGLAVLSIDRRATRRRRHARSAGRPTVGGDGSG
jgi:hypothetical protein